MGWVVFPNKSIFHFNEFEEFFIIIFQFEYHQLFNIFVKLVFYSQLSQLTYTITRASD